LCAFMPAFAANPVASSGTCEGDYSRMHDLFLAEGVSCPKAKQSKAKQSKVVAGVECGHVGISIVRIRTKCW
jgi:hypothetical protein